MDFSTIPSLPRPRTVDALVAPASPEELDQQLAKMIAEREELELRLGEHDARLRVTLYSTCGLRDESQDVEEYDGSLGVTQEFVKRHEPAIGQLQWRSDLRTRFTGRNHPGNVNGERWSTGSLIAEDLFLTAGHSFDSNLRQTAWVVPKRNGVSIAPKEIARLMRVNFNYQIVGGSRPQRVRTVSSFPVEELLEYREQGVDYAIVRLGRDSAGRLPVEVTRKTLKVAAADLTAVGATLCVIQHPNRQPKRIEAGTLQSNDGRRITYADIDSAGFASGSPVLSLSGEIVGVHVFGGCTPQSPRRGFNYGVASGAIRAASRLL